MWNISMNIQSNTKIFSTIRNDIMKCLDNKLNLDQLSIGGNAA